MFSKIVWLNDDLRLQAKFHVFNVSQPECAIHNAAIHVTGSEDAA